MSALAAAGGAGGIGHSGDPGGWGGRCSILPTRRVSWGGCGGMEFGGVSGRRRRGRWRGSIMWRSRSSLDEMLSWRLWYPCSLFAFGTTPAGGRGRGIRRGWWRAWRCRTRGRAVRICLNASAVGADVVVAVSRRVLGRWSAAHRLRNAGYFRGGGGVPGGGAGAFADPGQLLRRPRGAAGAGAGDGGPAGGRGDCSTRTRGGGISSSIPGRSASGSSSSWWSGTGTRGSGRRTRRSGWRRRLGWRGGRGYRGPDRRQRFMAFCSMHTLCTTHAQRIC